MSDGTTIEWTDATWNPITGCTVVSPGCTNCYAMGLAGTRLKHHTSRVGLTDMSRAGPVWNGEVRFNEQWLDQPLRWRRPRNIFVCAHGDLFHPAVPDEWIDRVFAVMALAPHHRFQVLTKRADRMQEYVSNLPNRQSGDPRWPHNPLEEAAFDMFEDRGFDGDPASTRAYEAVQNWPLPNVWLGVSVEDQTRADERIPDLLATPAAVRWISAEPLLGSVDLTALCNGHHFTDALRGLEYHDDPDGVPHYRAIPPSGSPRLGERASRLDWVVVGGESGPNARPMHPDWARSLRDQCQAAGVAYFFKQWGAWMATLDRDRDDPDWRHDYPKVAPAPRFRFLNLEGGHGFHGERVHVMRNVGKARAGRLLDGREWNEVPT
ncbi:DUF5131 family protein [Maritimibacter alexandrii]|uniref:DUF5131 family protein n=1 Tax=Maritimibacter alexandrii TaxID=2570355 RepID=UPI00110927FC|nr:phage Gp37/Gp68 family protein [Maritimibacter alexandrii]